MGLYQLLRSNEFIVDIWYKSSKINDCDGPQSIAVNIINMIFYDESSLCCILHLVL